MNRPQHERPVIGLIPAAGRADRLGALPCSKEIYPLGFDADAGGTSRPRPVCGRLLESLALAGVSRAFVLLRKGKWDIPALLGDGDRFGLPLAYLALEPTASVPETLDRAYPFIAEATVALGFPDIVVEPGDAYRQLLRRLRASDAAVVLGLFPTDQSWKCDMVELDEGPPKRAQVECRNVQRSVIKQAETSLRYTWSLAVWGPRFSRYLHDFVARSSSENGGVESGGVETYVGDVIQSAIDDGMEVIGERFEAGSFLDVGTPEDLLRASARFAPRGAQPGGDDS